MKVVFEKFPFKKRLPFSAAAIGFFDGLHKGHKLIIKELILQARKSNLKTAVITFWPHPQKVIKKKNIEYITTLKEKVEILNNLGIDYLLIVPSHKRLFQLKAEKFLNSIFKNINIKIMVVGDGFRFGYQKATDVPALKNYADRLGFKVKAIKRLKFGRRIISSSLVREAIKKAKFSQARKMLGYDYFFSDVKVVKGLGIGKYLGYPTINVVADNKVLPPNGVYIVKVTLNKKEYLGLCNIGFRPTVLRKNKKRVIEIYIIGYKVKRHIKNIKFSFLEYLRPEKKFPSFLALKQAIAKDISRALAKYSALNS